MEEENKETTEVQETPQAEETSASTPDVGFPVSQPKPKSKMNKWIIIIIGLLILGAGGVYLFSRSGGGEEEASPTPTAKTSTPTPEATSTPAPADKEDISIEILNGTGISGEAASLETQLGKLGYTDITTGNAPQQDHEDTEVSFSASTPDSVKAEITAELKKTYDTVNVKSSSTQKSDVVIITGLKKGATAKPSATPTGSPKASPTGSPKASTSPTPTATP